MKTWDEMSEHEQLSSIHYELYKDVTGVRPRHIDYDKLTVADLKADLARLEQQLEENTAFEQVAQAEAVRKFEERVARTIALGAKDRETAIRWLFEAENDPYVFGDPDYYCSQYGLPYGYFNRAA
jgi:hypothetical protein